MEKRESIIRKLNALKAKANDPSIKDTPEAINAMAKFNELMQRYNLTLTDLEIKAQGINFGTYRTSKGKESKTARHPISFVTLAIREISNTEVVLQGYNKRVFVGTPSDVQYAEFLYDLIYNSCERAAVAFKMGVEYSRIINTTRMKGDEVLWNFKRGFVVACYHAIQNMIKENKGTGTDLVVLKNELIKSFLDDNGMAAAKVSNKSVAIKDEMMAIVNNGYKEGAKVKLRNEITNVAGYLS